jgi:adenylate cyclase
LLERAVLAVNHAMSLEEGNVECHRLMCEVFMIHRKLDQAMVHSDRALAMNPNDPRIVAQRGELLTWLGKPEEGVEWVERAVRLDPLDAPARAHLLGRAYFGTGRYKEAARAYRTMSSLNCGRRAELAASLKRAGQDDDAAAAVVEFRSACATFSTDAYVKQMPYARQEDRDRLTAGLRAAGL